MFYIFSSFFFLSIAIFSFSDEAKILKSFTFHHEEFDKSVHTGAVAVVKWSSADGIARFERSKYKGDFFRLADSFKAQGNAFACAQATGQTILSAIYRLNNKPAPIVEQSPIAIGGKNYPLTYRAISDENFFNEKTRNVLNEKEIYMKRVRKDGSFGGGMDMHELKKILSVHGVSSKIVYVNEYSDSKVVEFREKLKHVLNCSKEFIVGNYDHSYKNLIGGHYSIFVAYDEVSDSVLILDVAAHRNGWIWINLVDLYRSMNTKNYNGDLYRGYMIIDSKIH